MLAALATASASSIDEMTRGRATIIQERTSTRGGVAVHTHLLNHDGLLATGVGGLALVLLLRPVLLLGGGLHVPATH